MADLDTKSKTNTAVHLQQFSVPYEFPVYFTEDLFDIDNMAFVEAISRLENDKTHKALIFIDDGLTSAYPDLLKDIIAYTDHHKSRIELVTAPVLVPGGEKIKSDQSCDILRWPWN